MLGWEGARLISQLLIFITTVLHLDKVKNSCSRRKTCSEFIFLKSLRIMSVHIHHTSKSVRQYLQQMYEIREGRPRDESRMQPEEKAKAPTDDSHLQSYRSYVFLISISANLWKSNLYGLYNYSDHVFIGIKMPTFYSRVPILFVEMGIRLWCLFSGRDANVHHEYGHRNAHIRMNIGIWVHIFAWK